MHEHAGGKVLIDAVLETLQYQQRLIEGAVQQLGDQQLHEAIAPGTNSIAVILKHLAGNLRSRWTDFLTSDGEKSSRDRETEFADDGLTRDEALDRWRSALAIMRSQIEALSDQDLRKTVTIRGQPHSVPRAICRALDHNAYHTGQIVLIAKALAGPAWKHLTVPPGGSRAFNASLGFDPNAAPGPR